MALPQLQLHDVLLGIAENVYFQPPQNDKMLFPCILYSRDGTSAQHADNELFRHAKRYQVTVIDRDPESVLADKVERLRYCSFERQFKSDGLNHYVFSLFF